MMSAPVIQCRYDQLHRIAALFEQEAERTIQLHSRLSNNLDALENGGWEGRGSQAFFREMNQDILPAIQRLQRSLFQAQTTTLQIAAIFREAEKEAARPFGAYDAEIEKKKIDSKTRITGVKTFPYLLFQKGRDDDSSIHPNDVSQGALGDCYFVASLAAVAKQNPGLIRRAIRDNGDGTYTVTLYKKTGGFLGFGGHYEPVEITVTGEFPKGEYYSKEAKQWVAVTPHVGTGDKELWPLIFEKAYGQLIAGDGRMPQVYKELNEGGFPQDALTALTGKSSETHSPDHYTLQELVDFHQKGYALVLSSKDKYRNGTLVQNHAYWIESINMESGVVIVRNPWGYDNSKLNRIEIPFDELDDNFRSITINPLR